MGAGRVVACDRPRRQECGSLSIRSTSRSSTPRQPATTRPAIGSWSSPFAESTQPAGCLTTTARWSTPNATSGSPESTASLPTCSAVRQCSPTLRRTSCFVSPAQSGSATTSPSRAASCTRSSRASPASYLRRRCCARWACAVTSVRACRATGSSGCANGSRSTRRSRPRRHRKRELRHSSSPASSRRRVRRARPASRTSRASDLRPAWCRCSRAPTCRSRLRDGCGRGGRPRHIGSQQRLLHRLARTRPQARIGLAGAR